MKLPKINIKSVRLPKVSNISFSSEMMSREEMLAQIKTRFTIVIILSVLFSNALASLYPLTGDASGAMAFWGTLVPAIYLAGYVLYELFNKKIASFVINMMRKVLLIGIGMFVFPVTMISFYKNGMELGFGMKTLLYLSISGIPFVSIVFVIIAIAGVVLSVKIKQAEKSS